MKKSLIALIISVIFLTICMFLVVKGRNNESNIINDMTIEYVDTNYEIDLYDEIKDKNIILTASAKYIGNDKVEQNPNITLQINCSYVYEDADQKFTDLLTDDLIIKSNDNKLNGNLKLEINRDSVDSYSCSYKVVETDGKYAKTTK